MHKTNFWLTFSCIKGVGNATVKKLYEVYPYFNEEYLENDLMISKLPTSIKKFLKKDLFKEAEKASISILEAHNKEGIEVIDYADEYYPELLRFIKDPPSVIYTKGNKELLKSADTVAIIGTRNATDTGLLAAKKISSIFAEKGYTIVSGLALGIDTAAHEGALRVQGGKTIAIMAEDLTKIYPKQNKQLAEDILEQNGLLLSETPIGQKSLRGNFVKRDRIQSGLSLGVCPVQTAIKSGTQHTIKYAKEQKRFLFTPTVLERDLKELSAQGNLVLLAEGCFELKNKESYAEIESEMQKVKANFLESKPEKKIFMENSEQKSLF